MTDERCPVCASPVTLFHAGTITPAEELRQRGYRIAEGQRGATPTIWRCAGCGLGFVRELPDPREFVRAYHDAEEDPWYLHEFLGRRRAAARVLKRLERYATPPGTLLDVGCGPGVFLQEARRAGWNVRGLEPSAWGRRVAAELLVPGVVRDGDVLHLSAAYPETFDAAVALDVIEHVTDPFRALGELAGRLRPGGVLVLTTPRFDSFAARLLKGRWPAVMPAHLWYFTAPALTRLLARAGLRPLAFHDHRRYFSVGYLAARCAEFLWKGRTTKKQPAARSSRWVIPMTIGDEWEVYARRD